MTLISIKEIWSCANADSFDGWLEEARNSNVPELKAFVRGIEDDRSVIEWAIASDWSNGQTEGQVNRLKVINRSMYGRAKPDLLKARVLNAV